MSDSVWPHGLQPTRLLCPWDFPGRSTGVISLKNLDLPSFPRRDLFLSPRWGQAPMLNVSLYTLYLPCHVHSSPVTKESSWRKCLKSRNYVVLVHHCISTPGLWVRSKYLWNKCLSKKWWDWKLHVFQWSLYQNDIYCTVSWARESFSREPVGIPRQWFCAWGVWSLRCQICC